MFITSYIVSFTRHEYAFFYVLLKLIISSISIIFAYNQMDSFLMRLDQVQNWKHLMRQACKTNGLCTSLAGELTPNKIKLLNERFKRAYTMNQAVIVDSWIEHQMRAFNWLIIALSALENVKIEDFGSQQWITLYQIFQKKSATFLRYQARRFLLQKSTKNRNWGGDQNKLLSEIVTNYQKDKILWNEVARKLFQQSQQKYFRTSKHCRERWLNYLDPTKSRGNWARQEDIQLLDNVVKTGKKWAELALLLKRTEHSVKNRFNSIITRQKKANPSYRKQQKLIEMAKRNLQIAVPIQLQRPKIGIKFKSSSESIFDDNRSDNREPIITVQQVEAKSRMDYLQNFTLEGGHFIEHLIKEDEQAQNKNQSALYQNLLNNSPKNITPLGFSPSPFALGCTAAYTNPYYYYNNFTTVLQKQSENEDEEKS